jgi:predicted RNA binding protein YcfA (HicA-like mRNA interferase family)
VPKLPSFSGKEAVKAFKKVGWSVARQSGSHIILVKGGLPVTLSVPNHNPIARGTLRVLISSSGLSVEEFIKLIGSV